MKKRCPYIGLIRKLQFPNKPNALLCVIYGNMILYGFVFSMQGVLFPLIKNAYDVSYTMQGLMVSLVSFTLVLSSITAGVIFGVQGFKKTIGIGFFVLMPGMIAFRFSWNFLVALGLIIVIQFGLGFFQISLNGMGVKTFTRKSAMMISLLHFSFGFGATLGPWFGGIIANNPNFGWRNIYLCALLPVIVAAFLTIIFSPGKVRENTSNSANVETNESGETARNRGNFRWAITNPMVWLFGLCMGLTSTIEYSVTNWSGLYLYDVFGLDPKTTGATFISVYFFLYTISRLLGGFFIEKIGYLRSVFFAAFITLCLLITGFVLGRRGIWVLPVTGLFIGIVFPTVLAISIGFFKERVQATSSTMLVISSSLSSTIQYLVGLTNRYIGEAWGYRSSVLYGILLVFMLIRLHIVSHKKAD
jgi:fucose permease